jgi:hypothetical protein
MAAPAACTRFSDNYELKEELGKWVLIILFTFLKYQTLVYNLLLSCPTWCVHLQLIQKTNNLIKLGIELKIIKYFACLLHNILTNVTSK